MRRDIASAYVASGARIGSWVIVSAAVYRFLGPAEFAMLALVRGTIGLLNYTALGLAPAMIHLAAGLAPRSVLPAIPYGPQPDGESKAPGVMSFEAIYSNALAITTIMGLLGILLSWAYAFGFGSLYRIPPKLQTTMAPVVFLIGLGIVLRLMSDPAGAVLQLRSRIALDNAFLAGGDVLWALLTLPTVVTHSADALSWIGGWYAASGVAVLLARRIAATGLTGVKFSIRAHLDRALAGGLLGYGSLITLAQLADYLYAPTDYILIDRLLGPLDVGRYAPAVQIDAGLLLLVTGLASVLLPKAAVAHAAGSTGAVRRYYVLGTLTSAAMLGVASVITWIASPWLFQAWFGNSMPETRAILPLVLTHTVIGGSSAVGRSILLAVGKARPFTIAVLLGGVVNVACSFAFVRYLQWGLKGIVLGTIVAVVARCAIWMPWYVLRVCRDGAE